METDGFVLVKKKHAAKSKNITKKLKKTDNVPNNEHINFALLLKSIEGDRKQIQNSDLFKDLACSLKDWKPAKKVVAYGLGNISHDRIAKLQFAMLICILDHLELDRQCCSTYDPVFTETDSSLLSHYHISQITFNEEGKHLCSTATILFMPHCSRALYNNLLWSNWSFDNISNTCIIGNSFQSIIHNNTEATLLKYYPCIYKMSELMVEKGLANTFEHNDVFNNLSVHFFDVKKFNYNNNNDDVALDIFIDRPAAVEYDCDEDLIKS